MDAKDKQSLEAIIRLQWPLTFVFLGVALIGAYEAVRRHTELTHIPTYQSFIDGTIFHTAWISIFNAIAGPIIVFIIWTRVYRDRSLLAQEARERSEDDRSTNAWPPAPRGM